MAYQGVVLEVSYLTVQAQFSPGYQQLLANLQQRGEAIKAFLPALWSVTEIILAANPAIEA